MPIIHFINSKTQTAGGMKNVLAYVTRTEKTKSEDKQYVTALNCNTATAYVEMLATKNAYHKNSGRMYYHLVQSFPKGDGTPPELAHRIAVELAEKAFGKYECVVATHIDREHIHSHFVFNSVSFEDGRKYHSNGNTVQELMDLSDEICMRYDVTVLDTHPQKKKDVISDREYRSAVRGESWKFQLMNAVTEVMKQAKSKKQFVFMMKQLGYGVRWEDSRKYITYTCPNGRKCRCAKLHGEKFSKEMMEHEFKIRRECLDGTQQVRLAGSGRNHAHGCSGQQELDGGYQSAEKILRGAGGTAEVAWRSDDQAWNRNVPAESESAVRSGGKRVQEDSEIHSGTDEQFTDQFDQPIGETVVTGWETERGILLEAEKLRRMEAQNAIENAQSDCDFTVGALDLVAGIADVASIIDESEEDEDIERHSESKVLAEEIRRKEALGMHM
ncbi:MAG: relaxase/mobilization nuclease domain-containing protein [Oscillospiraceae bacterium]|nr:relaxase/mobilization nuclease domain-containing protein [Oscillospiraceae bacterium]